MSKPEDRYFESSRLRLHYVVWGDETKPPLLLVHGGRDHARSWDFVAQAVTDRFAAYAVDLRGHGDSDWPVGAQYRISDHVIDLAKLIDTLGRGPVSIIAHSMGGRVVLDYAGTFPERVAKLVIIEGFGWPLRTDRPAGERLSDLVKAAREVEQRTPRVYKTLEEAAERMQEANRRLTPQMAQHLTQHAVRRREDGGYVWKFDNFVHVRSLPDWSVEEQKELWGGVTAPVLLIEGSESNLRRPLRDELASALRDSQTLTVQGAGHWVHHDQLDEFVRLAREYLS
jgi:pimeloyl-ACP methyl ester carboxylesterase